MEHRGCASRHGEQGRDTATASVVAAPAIRGRRRAACARTGVVLRLPGNARHNDGTTSGGAGPVP
jgi:hypothetical protein